MEPIGLAIWGLHHQHPRWYWPLFANLPQFRPVCICDSDEEFLKSEAAFFQVDALADPAKMLERRDVEAVMIFLPHAEMPEAVDQAVAAGKHVLVEKPMGATVADVERICQIAADTPLKVTTGYCWRYDPVARKIKEWIAAGLLGEVIHFEGRMAAGGAWRYIRDHAPWMLDDRQGGGPIWNLGVHWIDLFHWWTGDRVITAQGVRKFYGGEPGRTIEDSAYALLEYESGAVGLLDMSYSAPRSCPQGRDLFISIRGTLGMVNWSPSWGGADSEALLVSDHESLAGRPVERLRMPTPQVTGYCGQMGLDYLGDWAEAIRQDRPVGIPPADGLRAAVVAEAIIRSADGAGRVEL
jgi:predicted dehydrogenase